MFWSLILQPGKKYSSTVKESFHLSTAVIDTKSMVKNDSSIYPVQVEVDGQELILCNLSNQCLQMNLDLMFGEGSKLTFLTTGKATIHLTGYTYQEDYSEDDMYDSEESSEAERSSVNLTKSKRKTVTKDIKQSVSKKESPEKRKMNSVGAIATKKAKLSDGGFSEDDDNSELDMDDSDLGDFSLSDEEDNDDAGEDDVEQDDSEDLEEEEDSDVTDDSDTGVSSTKKKNEVLQTSKLSNKTPVLEKKQSKTPISNKKLDNKLNKSNSLQLTNGVTPKSEKKDRKKNTPKPEVRTPKGNEPAPGTPQSQKKTMEGGVIIEELKQGNGPIAKPGKMVAVYYTGRLKNNNRVFDQSNTGPGFKFRLGRGEVIKGWDVALNGMKVGSKRRITCPPAMAYGAKGSPPSIPPNSSLVFDVELRSVN